MKKIWKIFLSLSAILLFMTACSEEATPANSDRPQVATSIYPVYEIVKEVAGDRADVSLMVGENEDAHHYEPSAQAVASVNEADVFIYSSEIMEFWADSLLDVVENDNLHIIEMSESLDLSLDETTTENDEDDHAPEDAETYDHGDHDLSHGDNADVEQTVVVDGVAGHYHTGDMIELTATHDSDYDHWHWFTRDSDSEEWEVVEDQFSNTLSGAAAVDGQEIKASLYDDDHNLIAESEPVTLVIDDHEGDSDHDHDHEHGTEDPHFWLDPVTVKDTLPAIVEGLSEADPEGAEIYQENADTFAEELDELDAAYREAFDNATNRSFVVQHQAFGHLADRYNLDQVSVGGMITEVEPNPQALTNIVNFVKDNNVPIIYYQSGESSSTAEAIANETDTEIAVLYDLESKPVDGDFEENAYIEVMYHNLEELQKSIQ